MKKNLALVQQQYVESLENFNRAVDNGCPAAIYESSRVMVRWQRVSEALTALRHIAKYTKVVCRGCLIADNCDTICPLSAVRHELKKLKIERKLVKVVRG